MSASEAFLYKVRTKIMGLKTQGCKNYGSFFFSFCFFFLFCFFPLLFCFFHSFFFLHNNYYFYHYNCYYVFGAVRWVRVLPT